MAFIDSWGRKPIQLMGFVLLTIIFVCMGFGYDKMLSTDSGKKAFVFLYCMANFFQVSFTVESSLHYTDIDVLELRAQHYNFYSPRRSIPYSLPINCPWYLRRLRQAGRHRCPGWIFQAYQYWWQEHVPQAHFGDLRFLHAYWCFQHIASSRD